MQKTAFYIACTAQRAMLYEVYATPKPGLVDKVNSGAHDDMDLFTFVNSTTALYPTMYHCALTGLENPSKSEKFLFKKIRKIGIQGEKDMFISTGGVNTQKGLIFILGIICTAIGHILSNKQELTSKNLSKKIAKMTEGIVKKELQVLENHENFNRKLTAGEILYLRYKITGIRGEVEKGLPTVIEGGLPELVRNLDSNLDFNSSMINTLLHIMTIAEDTNVLWRKGKEALLYMRKRARKALELGGMRTIQGRNEIKDMDRDFINLGISPGGSADLLATTLMVYMAIKKSHTF